MYNTIITHFRYICHMFIIYTCHTRKIMGFLEVHLSKINNFVVRTVKKADEGDV